MIQFDFWSIFIPLLLIEWLDIEIDSKKSIRTANSNDPYPEQGTIRHFFEGIVIAWIYVLLFAANVFFFNVSVWTCIYYVPFLLGWRFFFHPIYFALRVVVPRLGWSAWGHLGSTSGTDKLLRSIGLADKNHYLVRVPVALAGFFISFWLRFLG